MKVLHVVSGILGGAGRVAHELAGALVPAATSDALLFSTAEPDPHMRALLGTSCARVHVVTKAAKVDPLAVARVALVLRRSRPDVVLLHDFTAYVWASLAARATGRWPLVAVEHSNSVSSGIRRAVRRALHGGFAATICVSPLLEERLRAMGVTARVTTVRNGIDQRALDPLRARPRFDGRTLRLLMVGRLDHPKDHPTLFRAVRGVLDRGLAIELRVVGDGSLAGALAREAEALGAAAAIRFEGACTELLPYYEGADVVVLSSRNEGLPLALIEGMAAGCLAVGASVGAIGELLDGGAAGRLFAPGDVGALTDVLTEIARRPDEARALAGRGAARVARAYSAERMAEGYLEVFDRLGLRPSGAHRP